MRHPNNANRKRHKRSNAREQNENETDCGACSRDLRSSESYTIYARQCDAQHKHILHSSVRFQPLHSEYCLGAKAFTKFIPFVEDFIFEKLLEKVENQTNLKHKKSAKGRIQQKISGIVFFKKKKKLIVAIWK